MSVQKISTSTPFFSKENLTSSTPEKGKSTSIALSVLKEMIQPEASVSEQALRKMHHCSRVPTTRQRLFELPFKRWLDLEWHICLFALKFFTGYIVSPIAAILPQEKGTLLRHFTWKSAGEELRVCLKHFISLLSPMGTVFAPEDLKKQEERYRAFTQHVFYDKSIPQEPPHTTVGKDISPQFSLGDRWLEKKLSQSHSLDPISRFISLPTLRLFGAWIHFFLFLVKFVSGYVATPLSLSRIPGSKHWKNWGWDTAVAHLFQGFTELRKVGAPIGSLFSPEGSKTIKEQLTALRYLSEKKLQKEQQQQKNEADIRRLLYGDPKATKKLPLGDTGILDSAMGTGNGPSKTTRPPPSFITPPPPLEKPTSSKKTLMKKEVEKQHEEINKDTNKQKIRTDIMQTLAHRRQRIEDSDDESDYESDDEFGAETTNTAIEETTNTAIKETTNTKKKRKERTVPVNIDQMEMDIKKIEKQEWQQCLLKIKNLVVKHVTETNEDEPDSPYLLLSKTTMGIRRKNILENWETTWNLQIAEQLRVQDEEFSKLCVSHKKEDQDKKLEKATKLLSSFLPKIVREIIEIQQIKIEKAGGNGISQN